jgi:hypothetical protein
MKSSTRVITLLRELADELEREQVGAGEGTPAKDQPRRRRTHTYKPKHSFNEEDVREFRQRLAKRGIRT